MDDIDGDTTTTAAAVAPQPNAKYYRRYYTSQQKALLDEYIGTLTAMELKAMAVAQDHNKGSFDLLRSSGYVAWQAARAKAATAAAAIAG